MKIKAMHLQMSCYNRLVIKAMTPGRVAYWVLVDVRRGQFHFRLFDPKKDNRWNATLIESDPKFIGIAENGFLIDKASILCRWGLSWLLDQLRIINFIFIDPIAPREHNEYWEIKLYVGKSGGLELVR